MRFIAALLASFALGGCGGSSADEGKPATSSTTPTGTAAGATLTSSEIAGGEEYVTILEPAYQRARNAFNPSVSPCLARAFEPCAAAAKKARRAAAALLARLRGVDAPEEATAPDRELRDGFRALVAAIDEQQAAIAKRDERGFAESISAVTDAIDDIEAARSDLQVVFPNAQLPRMH